MFPARSRSEIKPSKAKMVSYQSSETESRYPSFTNRNLRTACNFLSITLREVSQLHVGEALDRGASDRGPLSVWVSTKNLVWLSLASSPLMFWFEQRFLRIVLILQIEMPVIWRGWLGYHPCLVQYLDHIVRQRTLLQIRQITFQLIKTADTDDDTVSATLLHLKC